MQNRFMLQGDALLLDMLQAASDAVEFVAALDQAQFIGSKLHQHAVIRCIEIIGEAARFGTCHIT
jgi:uncharacterized protein with HEPN domain